MAGTRRPKCPECGMKTISITARIGNGPDDDRPTSRKSNRRVGWICPNCPYMERTAPSFHLIEF
tara:strand:+ start:384 stop:575 length:192 start_codon:yes stop_codon:yes gene_type:complete